MHTHDDIQANIIRILKDFVPEGQPLEPETDLLADLGLDSMKVMDILAEIEDCFDISIPLNILPDISTISDFTSQIEKIMKEGV